MAHKFLTKLNDGTIICEDHGELEDESMTDHVRNKHPKKFADVLEKAADENSLKSEGEQ